MSRITVAFDVLFLAAVTTFTGAFWAAGGHPDTSLHSGGVTETQQPRPPREHDSIRLMTWNIAYARGLDSPEGDNWTPPSRREMRSHLEHIARVLREHRVDIALLQEIDFNSHRSFGINQFRELLRLAHFTDGARAVTWKANYIPYPLWPPGHHFGRVRSGGAVLSRYPIRANRVKIHPKPEELPWWLRMFFIPRYSQAVECEIEGERLWVVNNHLGASQTSNRKLQVRRLNHLLDEVVPRPRSSLLAVGGDFNSRPPKQGDPYARSSKDRRILPRFLESRPDLVPSVSWDTYHSDPEAHATVNADAPRTKLDYVLVPSERVRVESARVLHVRGPSDHRPVLVELRLRDKEQPMGVRDESR